MADAKMNAEMNTVSYVYFEQALIDEATSLDQTNKEQIGSFREKLKKSYQQKDVALKAEIQKNVAAIAAKYRASCEKIAEEKAANLKEAERNYAAAEQNKQQVREFNNIKKGIETVAKRALIKEKTTYETDVKLEKLRRSDLHNEYLALLNSCSVKTGGADRLRSKYLEIYGTFSLRAALTNKKTWVNLVPLMMLILIIIAYYIGKKITGYSGDLGDVINNGIFVAVVATGAVYIYSQGGFDMSLGNASLMCATIAALTYNATGNLVLSLVISIFLGAFLGIINAILATMLNLPVMVMTLTMMNILAAVHEAILSDNGGLISVAEGMIENVWVYASFLVIFFIICWFLFNYSKLGRRNKFIGSNKKAAKFNGINLMKAGIISFGISGIGLGICGFLFACSKTGGKYGASTVLSQVGLNVVIAIVFGGMTTSGGPKSKVSCAIIGAFFSVFLDEFFAAISTPTFQVGNYCYMAKGIVFLIVSLANMWDTRGSMLASGGSIQ